MTITTDESPEFLKAKIRQLTRILQANQMDEINVHVDEGYEAYTKEEDMTIYVRPKWRDARTDPPKEGDRILAISKSEKGVRYNCLARSWFRDTIYACWFRDDKFVIESHGPDLSATHWMPQPEKPQ